MTPTESMKAKVRAALADGTVEADGHSVLAPEAYAPHFTVAELGPLVRAQEPDLSYTGKAEVVGVDNLEFLGWLCEQVGGNTSVADGILGTGRRARKLVAEIARAVEADQVEEVPGSVNDYGNPMKRGERPGLEERLLLLMRRPIEKVIRYQLVPRRDRVGGRTGRLSSRLTVAEIAERLGFQPNREPDLHGKSTAQWSFEVAGAQCGIWDYCGARWSTHGPAWVFDGLFSGRVTEREDPTELKDPF